MRAPATTTGKPPDDDGSPICAQTAAQASQSAGRAPSLPTRKARRLRASPLGANLVAHHPITRPLGRSMVSPARFEPASAKRAVFCKKALGPDVASAPATSAASSNAPASRVTQPRPVPVRFRRYRRRPGKPGPAAIGLRAYRDRAQAKRAHGHGRPERDLASLAIMRSGKPSRPISSRSSVEAHDLCRALFDSVAPTFAISTAPGRVAVHRSLRVELTRLPLAM